MKISNVKLLTIILLFGPMLQGINLLKPLDKVVDAKRKLVVPGTKVQGVQPVQENGKIEFGLTDRAATIADILAYKALKDSALLPSIEIAGAAIPRFIEIFWKATSSCAQNALRSLFSAVRTPEKLVVRRVEGKRAPFNAELFYLGLPLEYKGFERVLSTLNSEVAVHDRFVRNDGRQVYVGTQVVVTFNDPQIYAKSVMAFPRRIGR